MKTTAIIPIFIPHKGCPNDCVFCNQKKITARLEPPSGMEVQQRIEDFLPTMEGRGISTIEIAFFGGSFTGLPMEEQREYLEIACRYKKSGAVQAIRLSTRPDYIDEVILTQLAELGVDLIELGVQSFDEEVLRLSGRGHSAEDVYEAVRLIKSFGFRLGIQLMIGLPGDTPEKSLESAKKAAALSPAVARLYPTVILEETVLYEQWASSQFHPWSQDTMVGAAKDMYEVLTDAGVRVIRVGLKSTDLISSREGGSVVPGTYHPAFRQLVCGRIARERLEEQLLELPADAGSRETRRITMESNGASFSNMIGNGGENRKYFCEKYPQMSFRFVRNDSLGNEEYRICERQEAGSKDGKHRKRLG